MRQQIISFARAVDRRVTRKINSLEKSEGGAVRAVPALNVGEDASKENLLKSARIYDIEGYYSNAASPNNYGYRISKAIYGRTKHTTRYVVRKGFGLARELRARV